MGPLPSADLTPAYPGVAPLGLGTGDVESFTGGCVGILKDWLLRALQRALVSQRDALCWEDLEATRLPDLGLLHIAEEIREYREMEGRSYRSEIESALGLSGAVPAQPKGPRAKRSTFKPGRRAPARAPVGVPPEASVTRRSAA